MNLPRRFLCAAASASLAVSQLTAAPVINEIMFHPPGAPAENPAEEWIEILNPSATQSVDVSGWKLTRGVSFTVPPGTSLAPGGYLVIAANVAAFQAKYPGFSGQLVGGWTGQLSGSGEEIQLDDANGVKVNDVTYADEGDWALRGRGVLSFSHRGWAWYSAADGEGMTLELRNAALGNGHGQNWGVSTVAGGTPGAANSVASTNVAPLIKDPKHRPLIPRTTDPIVVSCDLEDEAPGATATLRWRVDGAGTFNSLAMTHTDGDGDVEATIPAQPTNLTVIEWYISATDGTLTRTWPAPARTSDPGVAPETFAQVTNALLQVDNAFDPNANFTTAGNQPIYRLIMTNAERLELAQIGSTNGQEDSEATMNGTFISHDGTGLKVVYNAGFRNRGFGSALGPPNNFHVGFRSDDRWNDRASIALNCQYVYSQALGNALFDLAGIPPQDTAIVRVRVNGADLAEPTARMYGRYARIEGRGGDWAEHHFPNDPSGNFYRLDDHAYSPGDPQSGEFRFEGTDPALYSDTFFKETNKDANDYSDLIELARVVSAPATGGTVDQPAIPDGAYVAAVSAKLDLDQFYRFIATDALIGNQEGGLQSGRADDVSIYRGIVDPRFRFIPHDMDDVFNIGNGVGDPVTRSLFSYDTSSGGLTGLTRLFNHPELLPRYYAAVLEAMDTWFNSATIDPLIDQIMAGWVPASNGVSSQADSIAEIKSFVAARRANVLGQIQQAYSLNVTAAGVAVGGYPTTTDGAATFSGTFNVAKTYSVTVNGQLAQWFYRTAGADASGTWKMVVPAGGGGILSRGLNRVVVNFWDGPGGSGKIVQSLSADVFYNATGTTISGTLSAGSLRLTAPSSYVPGKPFLARVELLDAAGNLDRTAWDTTVTLTSNVAGMTFPTVQLYNGQGSALITAGGSVGGGTTMLIQPGGTSAAPNALAPDWRMLSTALADPVATWKSDQAFDDSTWTLGKLQAGGNDGDERTNFGAANVDTAQTPRRAFYFRKIFTVADPTLFTQLIIRAVVDDGAIFYLNGTQVQVDNMPATTPAWNTPASSNRSGTAETQIRTFDISAFRNLLVPGNNLLAVQVHNYHLASPLTTSADLSFDCQLEGIAPPADPGTFTLSASGGGFTAQKAITSLGASPTITTATSPIAADTTWSGVVRVSGNLTVNAGATLTIAAGTHVFIDGNATAGSTTGTSLTVNGALVSQGTQSNPVSIAPFTAGDKWGQILFSSAQPSALNFTLLHGAGHSPTVGHTGKGPMLRLNNSTVSLLDSVLADGPAKAVYTDNSGTSALVIQRSLIERMITGPELEQNCSLLIEDSNIQRILPDYRESNDPGANDEDCLYVHNPTSLSVVVRRSVFARCGDDVFDGLGGPLVVEKSILREGWDKGMSLLNNDLTITDTQIIRCDKAIVPKSNSATTRTITVTNCTIVSENHDSSVAPWGYTGGVNGGDPDTPSTGLYTQNKSGQSDAGAILAITAKNCIVIAQQPVLVDAPYSATNTVVTYSDLTLDTGAAFAWPGVGNIAVDPLFAASASGDFRLTAGSPARDTGDPASPLDADGSRADMGALRFSGGAVAPATITWTAAGSPYRLTGNTLVPTGVTLIVNPGVSVQFNQNVRLTVNGTIRALGTPSNRIVFSHVPGAVAPGDADPIKNGTQTGPPKWGGVRVVDSMATESRFTYCDFINAQGTDPATSENYGSLGFIRSWGFCEGLTFAGTHLRMLYGRNCKLTVLKCVFPDMFIFDPLLGRIEEPTTDFLSAADNRMEPLKVEFPTTDAEVTGANAANFPNGLPLNGHWRVYYNQFNGNRGHQDVFDGDSGRWAPRDVAGNQTNGQFMLDCRYNHFRGLAGDEHIDLGGDAYIASNIFENARKDFWTNDTGYSNAISSGDKGTGTTIMVARNVCYDLDHIINLKASTATIFEHNTVANIHADFQFVGQTVTQNVVCAPINFFIPGDGGAPTNGDGAYLGFNIISNVPHVFSGPDASSGGPITTKIEFFNNLLDQIADPVIGPNHPGGYFSGTYGPNQAGAPGFVNPAAEDYSLTVGSAARRTAPGGFDYGATIPEWAYIVGGPNGTTGSTSASFTIGGPGLVAYKWRLNGGAWSSSIQIGDGGLLPRTGPTVRQATLNLTNLTAGTQTLEVLGQDMAGNWQDADPARTVVGAAQAAPTSRTWTVDPTSSLIRISEVLAESPTIPDTIELTNLGTTAVNIGGWTLTDDPAAPAKFTIPANTVLAPGAFITFASGVTTIALDRNGDAVFLYSGATLVDSIAFGNQIAGFSIGRSASTGAWTLCTPTLGAANSPVRLGDATAVRISEWFSSGDVLYDADWIELHNPGALPVDLAGLRLTDNRAGDPLAHVFAPLTFLGANGFARFIADSNPAQGPSHLGFSLDAEQERISLLSTAGTTLDSISFFPQTTDYSMGRDQLGNYVFYELPTRGFTNGTSDPGYANALAILRGLRISELMYNAIGGSDFDFVELTNVGATPLNLAGVSFVQGITFTFPAMTLNPGEYVVVAKNQSRFRSRYGNAPVVAGVFGGQLDNGGETLGLQLPPPFDANALTFAYSDGWFPPTDGSGPSLYVPNPLVHANVWGDRGTWAASLVNGGDPGGATATPLTYSGWSVIHTVLSVAEDDDLDAVPALVEFSLGMSNEDPNAGDGAAGVPRPGRAPDGRATLSFLVPENLAATQGHGFADVTYRIQAADVLGSWTTIATKTYGASWSGAGTASVGAASGGFVPVTITDTAASGSTPRFLRLQMSWTP